MIPLRSQTGTPAGFDGFRHFTSSTISASDSRMIRRRRASVAPRQSPSDAILESICSEAVPSCAAASVMPCLLIAPSISNSAAWPFSAKGQDLLRPLIGSYGTAATVDYGRTHGHGGNWKKGTDPLE